MVNKNHKISERIGPDGKKIYSIDGDEFTSGNVNKYRKYLYHKNKNNKLARMRELYAQNGNNIKDKKKEYYLKNKTILNNKATKRAKLNYDKLKENPEAWGNFLEKQREIYKKKALSESTYYLKNKTDVNEKHRKYHLKKYKSDPQFKIKTDMRTRINSSIRTNCKLPIELGMSTKEFKAYLESLFKPGMGWENRKEWHIDHIKPVKDFDLTNPTHKTLCYHYSNLKPMWAKANREKAGSNGKSS